MFCAVGQPVASLLRFAAGHLGWTSPFSCIVEEYHDNVAWYHSGRNSLKQGGYCSKMKQGGVGYSDCAMNLWKTGWFHWRRIWLLCCLQLPTHWKYFVITFVDSFLYVLSYHHWYSYNVQFVCLNKSTGSDYSLLLLQKIMFCGAPAETKKCTSHALKSLPCPTNSWKF